MGFFLQGHSLVWQQAKQDKLTQRHKRHKEQASWVPPAPATADSAEPRGEFWLGPASCLFLIRLFQRYCRLMKEQLMQMGKKGPTVKWVFILARVI